MNQPNKKQEHEAHIWRQLTRWSHWSSLKDMLVERSTHEQKYRVIKIDDPAFGLKAAYAKGYTDGVRDILNRIEQAEKDDGDGEHEIHEKVATIRAYE